MKTRTETLMGYTPVQLLAVLAVGVAVSLVIGLGVGLISVATLAATIQYRNYRKNRPEAAWEISDKGTRELWNDGPKAPMHRTVRICADTSRLAEVYGSDDAASVLANPNVKIVYPTKH